MRNEKGLTLIELLAALAVSGIIMAVAFALFSGVRLGADTTVKSYEYDAKVRTAMNTVLKNLSDCPELYRMSKGELRIITGEGASSGFMYKALVTDPVTGTLTLYTISKANYDNKTPLDYTNAASYSAKRELANNVKLGLPLAFNLKNESTNQDIALSTTIKSGELLRVKIDFVYSRPRAGGGFESKQVSEQLVVKMLKEK